MAFDRGFAEERFGKMLDLGPCLVGENLNLLTLRGFARLDALACISAPDVYDQVDNPTGTQRELKKKHAEECLTYAIDSESTPATESPRLFPELLLNARDSNAIELYDLDDDSRLYDFTSFSEVDDVGVHFVGVRVDLSVLELPKSNMNPQISRVDGNHRLYGAEELLEALAKGESDDEEQEFPTVAFCLLIDLEADLEAALFRDINGEHQGMEVAHLTTLRVRTRGLDELKNDSKNRPLWIAYELTQAGRAFEGMVFMGGTKTGLRKIGSLPPIKINSLRSTIDTQLKAAPRVTTMLATAPEALLGLVDAFWKAVETSFPEAWGNKRDFILLQAIGLGAFAKFGGQTLDRAFQEQQPPIDQATFTSYLAPVKSSVSLSRSDYPGIAGAGGAQFIAELLIKASEPDKVKVEALKEQFADEDEVDEKLAKAAEAGPDGS